MKKTTYFFLIIFHHLKLVFNVFQVLVNVFSSLSKKQTVKVGLFSAFKKDGKTRVVFRTEGIFFIYVFKFGFIDQNEGEIDMLFANKKVKAIFIGLRPCIKTVSVSQAPYHLPFAFKQKNNQKINNQSKPKLIKQLQFKSKDITTRSINELT